MYATVEPTQLPGFPSVLGLTSEGHTAADLHVNPDGAGFRVTLQCTERAAVDHPSTGIGVGLYPLGTATLKDGVWRGEHLDGIRTGATPVVWSEETLTNAEPGREYPFLLSITAETAQQVRLREEEHLADYLAAWDCSMGRVRWALEQITTAAPSVEVALTWLTQVLVGQGWDYLVPADPHDVAAWDQRIRTAHMDLCGQSKKRDQRREHSPLKYTVWMDPGPPQRVLYTPTDLGELHPDSYAYVAPSEVAVVYGGHLDGVRADSSAASSVADSGVSSPAMAVGDKVIWVAGEPTLEAAEMDVHAEPDTGSVSLTDVKSVTEAVRAGMATVHSLGEVHAWVAVKLADLAGDFLSLAGSMGYGDTGYIKLRVALLRPSS